MKTFGRMKIWFILSIGVLLVGCASVRDARILDREIDILHSRINALQKENKSLESKMSTLSAENQKLRTDLLFRVENVQSEVRTLSTSVEEYKDYVKRPSKEIGRVKEDVDGRLRVLEEVLVEKRSMHQVAFSDKNPREVFGHAVDRVYYRGLTVADSRVLEANTSDHAPIWVQFGQAGESAL